MRCSLGRLSLSQSDFTLSHNSKTTFLFSDNNTSSWNEKKRTKIIKPNNKNNSRKQVILEEAHHRLTSMQTMCGQTSLHSPSIAMFWGYSKVRRDALQTRRIIQKALWCTFCKCWFSNSPLPLLNEVNSEASLPHPSSIQDSPKNAPWRSTRCYTIILIKMKAKDAIQ